MVKGIFDNGYPPVGVSPYGMLGATWVPGVQRNQNGFDWSQEQMGIQYSDLKQQQAPTAFYQPLIRFDEASNVDFDSGWPPELTNG